MHKSAHLVRCLKSFSYHCFSGKKRHFARTFQSGFIQLSLMGWMAVGAAAIILGMSIALKIQTYRLASVKQEYAGFQAQVKAAGDAAKVKADAEIKRQEQVTKEVSKTYENRISSIRSSYDKRLRDAYTAGGGVQPIPDAPRSVDEIPANAIPLGAICAETTEQLIQLQGWVTEMGR